MLKVTLVRGQDDWEGLYIDGELVTEAHSLNAWTALVNVSNVGMFSLRTFTVCDVDEQRLQDVGGLPHRLSDLAVP